MTTIRKVAAVAGIMAALLVGTVGTASAMTHDTPVQNTTNMTHD